MIIRLFTLLLLLVVAASAQTPAPPEVHVKLSFAENKTIYRIGEPIQIVMEFTADREGYTVEHISDGNELQFDKVTVSPETGITHWYDEFTDNRHYGRDYFSIEKLNSSPRRVVIVLNELLEARLKRWQEQWRDRVAQADAQHEGQVERELIYALVNGKSWKLPAERVRALRASCLTQMCKQNNVVSQ